MSDCSEGDPWIVKLTLQGKPVALYIDTGAEVTVITRQDWRSIGQPQLEHSDRTLRGPDSHVIPTAGKFIGTFTMGDRTANTEVYVAKRLTKSLLGRSAIIDLQLIKRIATISHSSQQQLSPKDEFPSLFKGLGKFEGEYTIELKEDAEPYSLSTPRRVAIPLLKSVRQELERMERIGENESVDHWLASQR